MKFRTLLILAGFVGGLFTFGLVVETASAASLIDCSNVASGSGVCAAKDSKIDNQIKNLINFLMFLVGAISVVVIIIGGLKYVASDGDPGKIKSAKDTILYAIVGIVVAILASAIVNFVVGQF